MSAARMIERAVVRERSTGKFREAWRKHQKAKRAAIKAALKAKRDAETSLEIPPEVAARWGMK